MLQSIDLFSGVGGISLALRGFAVTRAYCESAANAAAVLSANMDRGWLHRAPICPDVKQFSRDWWHAHVGPRVPPPNLVTAGFPCVGFSPAGKREGFGNAQSSLFFEVLKVVDAWGPEHLPLLFMENSADLLMNGMDVMFRELCMKRGYELRWCTLAAHDVGAPQLRKRWYGLAVPPRQQQRQQQQLGRLLLREHQWFRWNKRTEPVRMDVTPLHASDRLLDGTGVRGRQGMLGNSVVPDVVRAAFMHLLDPYSTAEDMRSADTWRMRGPLPVPQLLDADAFWRTRRPGSGQAVDRKHGVAVHTGRWAPIPAPPWREARTFRLTISPAAYRPPEPKRSKQVGWRLTRPVQKTHWGTLTRSDRISNVLTYRNVRKIMTQVRFEQSTPDASRSGWVRPEFLEWIMGLPRGWTAPRRAHAPAAPSL